MRLNEYQELALRTESAPSEIIGTQLIRGLHGSMGMCTEAGELLEVNDKPGQEWNRLEESGDCCWYIAPLCDSLGIDMEDLDFQDKRPEQEPLDGLIIYSAKILDKYKRSIFYGKELERDDIITYIEHYLKNLFTLCDDEMIDIDEMLECNIEKLRRRYPTKFCSTAAIERDLTKERQVFEK